MSVATGVRRGAQRRDLSLILVGALALSLLPLVGLAQPKPVENPQDACPREDNPPAPFVDRLSIPEVHRRNVDCAFNVDITEGFSDQTYRPALIVRRDQFASFMVRTMRAADVDLPAPSEQGFTDISGNVHADNVNILAQTGIVAGTTPTTYSPAQSLFRDQIASMVLRAASFIEDVPLENIQRETGPFTDVSAGNVHRRNINGARGLNLTVGRTGTTFEPRSGTRRDQMASFLVRLLATLTGDEPLVPAEDFAETLELTPETATNPVNTDHSVTATVRDADGELLAEANVRFEVYRDTTGDGELSGPVTQGTQRTDSQGEAGFTFTGPDVEAEDVIVACPVHPEETCDVDDADDATAGTQFSGAPGVGARVSDTAAKTWTDDSPPIDVIDIDEDDLDATNFLDESHTISATAMAGGVAVPDVEVRFEVYRAPEEDGTFSGPVAEATVSSDAQGRVSFTYGGPGEPAVDRIVVCAPDEGSCQVTDEDSGTAGTQFTGVPVVGAQPNAVATKRWVSRPDQIVFDEEDLDATNPLNTSHSVTVTVLDADAQPIEGTAVRFEVYRAPDEDGTFSGPVEEATVSSGAQGRVSFTYGGPGEPAVDRIVVCAPDEGSCQVTDEDSGTAGTQFTGVPVVGAQPNAVATKRWVVPVAADSLEASAYGVNVEMLNTVLIERLPEVSVSLPPGDTDEQTADVLEVPLAPLANAGVAEVTASGDRVNGIARGEAVTADVEVLGEGDVADLPDGGGLGDLVSDLLGGLGGQPLVTADAVRAVSTSTCPDPGSLVGASSGSQFVNLTVAGTPVPVNPEPNTLIEVPGVAEVMIREVIPADTTEGHGFTVRGLRVTLLDGSGGEIIISEAHSSVVCAADVAATGAGLSPALVGFVALGILPGATRRTGARPSRGRRR